MLFCRIMLPDLRSCSAGFLVSISTTRIILQCKGVGTPTGSALVRSSSIISNAYLNPFTTLLLHSVSQRRPATSHYLKTLGYIFISGKHFRSASFTLLLVLDRWVCLFFIVVNRSFYRK